MMKWLRVFERPLKPGTKIDTYEILYPLGMGGYGITYLGKAKNIKGYVVLKQLRKYKQYSKKGIESFQIEKNILTSINHPFIPCLYEEIKWNDYHFLILEHKNGRTFEEEIFVYNKKFSEKQSFTYVLKLLDVVKYLHELKIVHRDLRIPNIILHHHEIYVIDFGLARHMNEGTEHIKRWKREKGLMRDITYQSDFYAIGHFVLFLLYSSFEPTTKREKSWEEELQISTNAKMIIRKLLMLDQPYEHVDEIIQDIQQIV